MCVIPLHLRRKCVGNERKCIFLRGMLELVLRIHDRQQAPSQKGVTNKDKLAIRLSASIHALRSLQVEGDLVVPASWSTERGLGQLVTAQQR